jgi:DNA polymerase V
VVLSNNDGCVIARSQEAKDLGIPMGLPEFKGRNLFKHHNVKVFSSNYPLYGSMSKRVVKTMSRFVPDIEVYSIDESFLNFTNLKIQDYKQYSQKIRHTVKKWTGIPISIGVACTKTLSKVANKIAKKQKPLNGVLDFTQLSQTQVDKYLKEFKISDVWGVGRQYSKKLKSHNIHTAYQLKNANLDWIQQQMTIQGKRTVLELRGKSCIPLELNPKPQKAICCSRSFGRRVTKLADIKEAISNYASRAAEKLRQGNQLTGAIQIFLHTSRFDKDKRYYNSKTITLPTATSATNHLIKHATDIIEQIYKPGYRYKKCGIILLELTPTKHCQFDMFKKQSTPQFEKDIKLSKIIDRINKRWGRDTVKIASQGVRKASNSPKEESERNNDKTFPFPNKKDWRMQRKNVSNRYTTVWSELMKVKLT